MKTWDELMKSDNSEEEKLILQLLETASTHPSYSHMTPREILYCHMKSIK